MPHDPSDTLAHDDGPTPVDHASVLAALRADPTIDSWEIRFKPPTCGKSEWSSVTMEDAKTRMMGLAPTNLDTILAAQKLGMSPIGGSKSLSQLEIQILALRATFRRDVEAASRIEAELPANAFARSLIRHYTDKELALMFEGNATNTTDAIRCLYWQINDVYEAIAMERVKLY